MKLAQSDFGGKLDAVTDSVVNFAMFVGVAIAAYRMAGPLYLKLFRIFMIGCALCAATAYWVYKTARGFAQSTAGEAHLARFMSTA